jgi:hypothetical protein
MEVINQTKEVPHYVVSADGSYTRYLSSSPTDEEIQNAKQAVLDYEKSAQSVIFARLMQRGVLSEIKSYCRRDSDPELTEEQKLHNQAVHLLDAVIDDDRCRAGYYLFTPKSEEDIKDLGIYHKLQFQYNDIFIKEASEELSRWVYDCVVGKAYIYYANHECEFDAIISPEAFIKSVTKMCDVFEKLGKAQRKAN